MNIDYTFRVQLFLFGGSLIASIIIGLFVNVIFFLVIGGAIMLLWGTRPWGESRTYDILRVTVMVSTGLHYVWNVVALRMYSESIL